jgi:hypothetical protein
MGEDTAQRHTCAIATFLAAFDKSLRPQELLRGRPSRFIR